MKILIPKAKAAINSQVLGTLLHLRSQIDDRYVLGLSNTTYPLLSSGSQVSVTCVPLEPGIPWAFQGSVPVIYSHP